MVNPKHVKKPIREPLCNRLKKKVYAKIAYNALAMVHGSSENRLKTLNLGMDLVKEQRPVLKPEDESERFQFQLYHYILHRLDFNDKNVLEVGCGVGGGCYYIEEYFQPRAVTGIDLISRHISLAQKYYGKRKNIQFLRADACRFRLLPESVDIVVDLESSHLYTDFLEYMSLVYKVLKPGGYFTFADMRVVQDFATIENIFHYCGFEIIRNEDVSQAVEDSIDLDEKRKIKVLKYVPFGKTLFRNFSFSKGSAFYKAFKSRKWVFKHYILQKPEL